MSKKLKVLCWSDSVIAQTGYGVTSKYILRALHDTGLYEIDQLAINYNGDFYDRHAYPYHLVPAKVLNPNDPHGIEMFKRTMLQKPYDIVWIMNDTYVVHKISDFLGSVRQAYLSKGIIPPLFIYYYPVDCHVPTNFSGMIRKADVAVTYTEYGREETIKVIPEIKDKLKVIGLGVNTSSIKPLTTNEKMAHRKTYFSTEDNEKFIICNVNRNSVRKQMPVTLLAFSEFRKTVPNSMLYLHTNAQDQGINLLAACEDLGLVVGEDVLFPANYSPLRGFPEEILNRIYNCADVFLSTHLGEGYGLSIPEGLAAGLPVVVPNNTNMPEFPEVFMYPCDDFVWVDNSGYRKCGRIEDIVGALNTVYELRGTSGLAERSERAIGWCKKNDWAEVGRRWVSLFRQAYTAHVASSHKDMVDIPQEII
jgi:glycosyltransferase involved in cell wall biosynthesis